MLKEYQKALQRVPKAFGVHVHPAALYVLLGRQEETHAALNKVLEQFSSFSVESTVKTTPFKNQIFHRLFFDALRKAELK